MTRGKRKAQSGPGALAPIEEVDMVEESIEAYREYGSFVNYSRALPNVCDGLKEVHRRIIYGMWDLGSRPDSKHSKSSRHVGHVMGKYHPHGDCLDGNTRFFCLDGKTRTMRQMFESDEESVWVLSVTPDGELVPTQAHSFRIGQMASKVFVIRLLSGGEIKATGNHQFMKSDGTWISAEEIHAEFENGISTTFMSGSASKELRPTVRSATFEKAYLQDFVARHFLGKSSGDTRVVHHISGDPRDNRPENLEMLTRAEHAKEHKDYERGLELGRMSMFSDDGKFREQTRVKNSKLMSLSNSVQGIRKAVQVRDLILDDGESLTEESYSRYRKSIYNAPLYSTLIDKGIITSESDLADLCVPKVDYSSARGLSVEEGKADKRSGIDSVRYRGRGVSYSNFAKAALFALDSHGVLTPDTYSSAKARLIEENGMGKGNIQGRRIPDFSQDLFEGSAGRYFDAVLSVEVESRANPIPMYDFTVDGHQNMLVISGESDDSEHLVVAHNSAIYQSMVNMSYDFTNNCPTIDGSGNWGSISAGAAAPRYTEARLSWNAAAMLGRLPSQGSKVAEIDEGTVDFRPNYDGVDQEPVVLPAMIPHFLVNPTKGFGAGKGYAVDSVPHNLNEVLDAAILIVDSPNARVNTLKEKLPGPDLPIGVEIYDTGIEGGDIHSYLTTGYGSFIMRAIYRVEEYQISARKKGKLLIVDGLPFNVSPEMVQENHVKLVESGKLPSSVTAQDTSDINNKIQVTFDIGEEDEEVIWNAMLYHNRGLQLKFSINMTAIVGGVVQRIGVYDAVREWVNHRRRVVTRRSIFRKEKAEARLHIVEGYIKAIPIADQIVDLVRKSAGRSEAHAAMMKKWKFSDIQASSILDMSIARITKMGASQFESEKEGLLDLIDECQELLDNPKAMNNRLKEEMRQTKKDLGHPRNCPMMDGDASIERPEEPEYEIEVQNGTLIRTLNNRIRWVYRNVGSKSKLEGDVIVAEDALDTSCWVECVTSWGNHARVAVEDVPKNLTNAKMIFKDFLNPGEEIVLCHSGNNGEYAGEESGPDLVLVTEGGAVKRLSNAEWNKHSHKRAVECVTLDDEEIVSSAFFLPEGADIVLVAASGMAIKIEGDRMMPKGRKARALPAIKLDEDDYIAFAGPSYEDYSAIAYVTDKGQYSAFYTTDLKYQSRNAKGVQILTDRDASIVGGQVEYDATAETYTLNYQDASGEMAEIVGSVQEFKPTKRKLNSDDALASSSIIHFAFDLPQYDDDEGSSEDE